MCVPLRYLGATDTGGECGVHGNNIDLYDRMGGRVRGADLCEDDNGTVEVQAGPVFLGPV
mgnify:CR=1 FL=1